MNSSPVQSRKVTRIRSNISLDILDNWIVGEMSLIMQKLRSPSSPINAATKLHHGQKLNWQNFESGEGVGER